MIVRSLTQHKRGTMKNWIFGILGGFVLLLAIGWVLSANSILMKKFLGVFYEDINREIFEETKSYNEGKIQQLAKYRLEYLKSDVTNKEAIQSTIQTMFADFDKDHLPLELKSFLTQMRGY